MIAPDPKADLYYEMRRVDAIYGPPVSSQESIGVIFEEFLELSEAVKRKDKDDIYNEAIHVASSAMRLASAIVDQVSEFFDRSGLAK